MIVSLFQQDVLLSDPAGNRKKIESVLPHMKGCDLFVLPEMFTTGFCTKKQNGMIVCDDGETMSWMARMSNQYHLSWTTVGVSIDSFLFNLTGRSVHTISTICFRMDMRISILVQEMGELLYRITAFDSYCRFAMTFVSLYSLAVKAIMMQLSMSLIFLPYVWRLGEH